MDWSWLVIAAAAWAVWVPLAWRILDNPMGNVTAGIAWRINWVYVRMMHGLRVEGREHVPGPRRRDEDGRPLRAEGVGGRGASEGLVVVSNHTAGVDPMLIQDACPFFIRWMMTAEMRVRELDVLWEWMEIIFVGAGKGGSELAALKDTMRYIKAGGVVGIFPEGRLERPPGVLHPFQPGLGLLVGRTGAKVLPVVVMGTPRAETAWGSLIQPSRSRVKFYPVIDYAGKKPGEIVADLQKRYEEWTGWGVVEAGE